MTDLQSGSRALTCSCGFFTSHASYMLLHLRESRETACIWSDAQRGLVLAEAKRLDREIQIAREAQMLYEVERDYLLLIFQRKPEPKAPAFAYCKKCGDKTKDRLAGKPMCDKHSGDMKVVYEALMSND